MKNLVVTPLGLVVVRGSQATFADRSSDGDETLNFHSSLPFFTEMEPTTSLSHRHHNAELYKLYAQAVVRFAFHPFETYADSPQEASMYERERRFPHPCITFFADDLVAEQWLLLHPSTPDFSISNVFEPIDSETYSKPFLPMT